LQQRGQTAIEAAEQIRKQRQEYRRTLEMELEQACYEAKLAQRRLPGYRPGSPVGSSRAGVALECSFRLGATAEVILEKVRRCKELNGAPHIILSVISPN
jgi:hypothetical protein